MWVSEKNIALLHHISGSRTGASDAAFVIVVEDMVARRERQRVALAFRRSAELLTHMNRLCDSRHPRGSKPRHCQLRARRNDRACLDHKWTGEGRVDYYYSIRSEGPELACRAEGPQPPEHTCVVALKLCAGKNHHQVTSSTGNDQGEGTKRTPWTLTSRRCTLRRYVT